MDVKFGLLSECYRSDLARLDASAEAAWYLSQLSTVDGSVDDFDYMTFIESCRKEQANIRLKLADLEDLIKTPRT